MRRHDLYIYVYVYAFPSPRMCSRRAWSEPLSRPCSGCFSGSLFCQGPIVFWDVLKGNQRNTATIFSTAIGLDL